MYRERRGIGESEVMAAQGGDGCTQDKEWTIANTGKTERLYKMLIEKHHLI